MTRSYSAQDNAMVRQIHMKKEVVVDHTHQEAFTMPRFTIMSLKECHTRMPNNLQALYITLLTKKALRGQQVNKVTREGNKITIQLKNPAFNTYLSTFILGPGYIKRPIFGTRLTAPTFEMVSQPIISLKDVKRRQFNVIDRHQKDSK